MARSWPGQWANVPGSGCQTAAASPPASPSLRVPPAPRACTPLPMPPPWPRGGGSSRLAVVGLAADMGEGRSLTSQVGHTRTCSATAARQERRPGAQTRPSPKPTQPHTIPPMCAPGVHRGRPACAIAGRHASKTRRRWLATCHAHTTCAQTFVDVAAYAPSCVAMRGWTLRCRPVARSRWNLCQRLRHSPRVYCWQARCLIAGGVLASQNRALAPGEAYTPTPQEVRARCTCAVKHALTHAQRIK